MFDAVFARKFVDADVTFDCYEAALPYFDALRARPLPDTVAIEQWLLDGSELAACLAQARTQRYVAMTCHTDDPDLAADYMAFVQEVDPPCRQAWHELNLRYTQTASTKDLPKQRDFVLDRSTRAAVELYREANLSLMVDQARLAQEYQRLCGEMTVVFDGQERTLPQMAVYGEMLDRDVREQAWRVATERRLQDIIKIEGVFDALRAVRTQMAHNADLTDYRDYAFKAYQRFDYGPEDCTSFHDAIEQVVVPVVRQLNDQRRRQLRLDRLRPWDLAVDVAGRPPLRPFADVTELAEKCAVIFERVDPQLGAQFANMRERRYLDLESRKGKAPGGYQSTFEEDRRPFIFMNAVGLHRDVETLLHEGGHAFHTYATRDEALHAYRDAPIEFAEVASMSMELLAMEHLDVFYEGDDLARAQRKQLEGILRLFPWAATIDAFQHWLYTHPRHLREERVEAWLALMERFGGVVDYSGYEEALAYRWHQQLHIFEVPFYYLEYAIAQLGALQVWCNAQEDRASAVRAYRAGLALGGSHPLPVLFETAGARLALDRATLEPLIAQVVAALAALPEGA